MDNIDYLRAQEEKRRERVKRQNEAAKNKWETVSCRLPKGTKARIEKAGETVNGLINRLVLEYLEEITPKMSNADALKLFEEQERQQRERERAEIENAKPCPAKEYGEAAQALRNIPQTAETDPGNIASELEEIRRVFEQKRKAYQEEKTQRRFDED